jgi:hypothetical protein
MPARIILIRSLLEFLENSAVAVLVHHYALPYNFTRFTLKVEPTALVYHLTPG